MTPNAQLRPSGISAMGKESSKFQVVKSPLPCLGPRIMKNLKVFWTVVDLKMRNTAVVLCILLFNVMINESCGAWIPGCMITVNHGVWPRKHVGSYCIGLVWDDRRRWFYDDCQQDSIHIYYPYYPYYPYTIHIQSIYPSSIVGRKPFQKIPGENVGWRLLALICSAALWRECSCPGPTTGKPLFHGLGIWRFEALEVVLA